MNKEWFIFKGTHHLGPFSEQEMEEFFTVGEINLQSLVWKEGAEKWEALGKTRDLEFLYKKPTKKPQMPDTSLPPLPAVKPAKTKLPSSPADLPDLPEDAPPPFMPKFLHPHDGPSVGADDFDEPPPIPLDALLNPLGKRPDFKKKPESKFNNSPKFALAALVTVFAMVLMWFYMNEKSSSIQIRIKGVMPAYVEKLQEIAAQKTPSIVVGMALTLDGQSLYASTNKDGEILTIIKLKSIPKRILGTTDVEILVRGVIKDHLGVYHRMQLVKGAQFVPGEYNVEFTGRKMFFLNRWFKSLNGIGFFKQFNTTYNYQTTALIYAGTPREFEKKILDYGETILNEKLKPYTDKLERFQTFSSLLNKTVEDYLLALESLKKPKDIISFEKKYMKEVSPIIQSLVVAANEIAKKTEADQSDTRNNVATYTSQVQMGKQIGELASDMITITGDMKKVTDADKAKLKNQFENRYKSIKSQLDAHMAKLQGEIQKISN